MRPALPGFVELLVLVLGAYRLTRLAGWDDFPLAVRIRTWATGEEWKAAGATTNPGAQVVPTYRRPWLAHLISCPFCVGFWISLAVYVAWFFENRATMIALAPFAISGAVGLIAKNLDP